MNKRCPERKSWYDSTCLITKKICPYDIKEMCETYKSIQKLKEIRQRDDSLDGYLGWESFNGDRK